MKIHTTQITNQNTETKGNTSVNGNLQLHTSKGDSGLPKSLSTLSQGDIFEGTVTRDDAGRITIHLANGESILARMEGDVSLADNTATFFQVKSNHEGQLALRAVSQDPSANPTLIKALEQAGVMVDTDNLTLVQEMMKQQLPIDAKSLAAMVRISYANKGVDPTTLVQLTKLGVPVTTENVQQFQQYMSGEGNVVQALDSIMTQLPSALENAGMSGEDAKHIFLQLCKIFLGEQSASQTEASSISAAETTDESRMVEAEIGIERNPQTEEAIENRNLSSKETPNSVPNNVRTEYNLPESAAVETEGAFNETESVFVEAERTYSEAASAFVQVEETLGEGFGDTKAFNTDMANLTELQQILGNLERQAGLENTTAKELLGRLMQQLLTMNLTKEDFQTLFQDKGFKNLLIGVMEQEWLLTPEEFKAENKLNEVYERMLNQLERLENLLHQTGKSEHPVMQDAKEVRANVQFMNDLGQLYNYVQIPLKMASQNTRGDLYIYTDKRAIKKGKEELTAHLHLEMEHLGTTDVFVHLKEKRLTTNFIMEKEEAFELVMEHIDLLTARLNQKGYQVSTKVEMKNEETKTPDFMQEVLGRELPSMEIQRYSLDVCI